MAEAIGDWLGLTVVEVCFGLEMQCWCWGGADVVGRCINRQAFRPLTSL